jgi:acyl-CoA synthetase (AMP-forming)/AMP-acid ligase II
LAELLLGDVPERNVARLGRERWAVRHGEDVLSWGELADRSLRRAHALAGQGVGQGDRVVLALPNCNGFHELTSHCGSSARRPRSSRRGCRRPSCGRLSISPSRAR